MIYQLWDSPSRGILRASIRMTPASISERRPWNSRSKYWSRFSSLVFRVFRGVGMDWAGFGAPPEQPFFPNILYYPNNFTSTVPSFAEAGAAAYPAGTPPSAEAVMESDSAL